jgi:hypothetical protein
MSDPSFEVQSAMVAVLKAGSVAAGRVYDNVSPATQFPYVTLGDCQVLPDKYECIDGAEIYPVVDVWSQSIGYSETKTITKKILALLDDKPLNVDGFNLIVFEVQSVNYMRDPDGLTRHAAITFHGILTPS